MWSRLAHIYIREEDLLKDLPPPYISTITTRITITAVRPSLTMSDLLYADMTYCSLCDRYFPGEEARAQHVQLSPNHPQCERCNRRFANKNSLRNHWVYSPRHHYCAVCEKDFRTAAGLRVHIEYAAVHRDDSDDESDDDDVDDSRPGWEDEVGQTAFPEENERADQNVSDDGGYSDDDEYWDEDDETEFEEERDAYFGFAATPVVRSSREESGYSSGEPSRDSSRQSDTVAEHMTSVELSDPKTDEQESRSSHDNIVSPGILFNCPLCLEPPNDSSATRCGHLFCTP
ncbi:hypothetical protein AcW1_001849 [Taiwanofungus camphoratus]|nr:hypothetical protein AcW1_001849 [Antrodia cinnamomea]